MGRAQQRRVHAGGFGTSYLEAGEPGAPLVVLVHDGAYGTDAALCWGDVIADLQHDHHLIAPDLLGWGGSDKVCYFDRSPYDFRLLHLGAFLRTLEITSPVVVVGSSFGAELAVRGTAMPEWGWPVRGTVAIAGTGGRMFRVPGGIEQLSDYEPSIEAAARITSMLVDSIDGLDDHVRQRYENSLTPGHWEALSALRLRNPAVERSIPPDPWPQPLATCPVRIHFVEGARDPLLEAGWAAKMAEITLHGSSEVVEGSHEPNIDHPAAVAAIVRAFVADLG